MKRPWYYSQMVVESSLGAGYFKTHCLELMDLIAQTGKEIIITKRGTPVAKIGPVQPVEKKPLKDSLRGSVIILGDIIGPTGEKWDAIGEAS